MAIVHGIKNYVKNVCYNFKVMLSIDTNTIFNKNTNACYLFSEHAI